MTMGVNKGSRGAGLDGLGAGFQFLDDQGGLGKAIATLLGPGEGLGDLIVRSRLREDEAKAISSLLRRGLRRPGVDKLLKGKTIAWGSLPRPLVIVAAFCLSRIPVDASGGLRGGARNEFVQAFVGVFALSAPQPRDRSRDGDGSK